MEALQSRRNWYMLFSVPILYMALGSSFSFAQQQSYTLDLPQNFHRSFNDKPSFSGKYINLAYNTFIFNPRSLSWKAVRDGKVVRTGRASGGSGYCKDIGRSCRTPSGTYYIISKGGANCRSSRYPLPHGGAKMPYCMFFSKYYAIHGSYDVPGYNASHGCIRVHPSDALWLHRNFINIGTKVVVQSY